MKLAMSQQVEAVDAFRHEAVLYTGTDGFIASSLAFIRGALAAKEPILVAVPTPKIDLLRQRLGDDASRVAFADMASIGSNPAWIIPAWREFVDRNAGQGRRLRGIGEPIYPERSASELVECQLHEALLNVAFEGGSGFWLVCPYDTAALSQAVIDGALRTHPFVAHGGAHDASPVYPGTAAAAAPFRAPLPEPAQVLAGLAFDRSNLGSVRRIVSREAARAGFLTHSIADLVLAASEVATNSVQHGGGRGMLRVWRDGAVLVCELRDGGHLDLPLAGRHRPAPDQPGGRGLWLANQLCDLVQIRSFASGTTVRLHMNRDRNI
jgi:anti-sigma regulatory factor (Ser/Thr protein kinase)